MRKLSKRERNLLSVFFVILLAVVGTEFLLFPSLEKTKMLEKEQTELQLKWDELQFYLGAEDTLKGKIEELSTETESLKAQLPSSQSSHLYWDFITNSAEKSAVEIIQIQEEPPDYTTKSRLIHINISGTFSDTIAFIDTLNKMPYINAISEGALLKSNEGIDTTLNLYISANQDSSFDQVAANDERKKNLNRNPFE